MTEFPVDMIGIVKTMFLRSLGNPNALVYTTNSLINVYFIIFFIIILLIIILYLIKILYNLFKIINDNKINGKFLLEKNNIKESLKKERGIFKILKYPTIGCILISTCRMYTAILMRFFEKSYKYSDIIRENLSSQELWVLGYRQEYIIFSFVLASYSIGLSFGNKMLRNIGILRLILGILLVIFLIFLNNGVIINGLPNFTV